MAAIFPSLHFTTLEPLPEAWPQSPTQSSRFTDYQCPTFNTFLGGSPARGERAREVSSVSMSTSNVGAYKMRFRYVPRSTAPALECAGLGSCVGKVSFFCHNLWGRAYHCKPTRIFPCPRFRPDWKTSLIGAFNILPMVSKRYYIQCSEA